MNLWIIDWNCPEEMKKMKIKVFVPGGYKIVNIEVQDDVKMIAEKFQCWEYVL